MNNKFAMVYVVGCVAILASVAWFVVRSSRHVHVVPVEPAAIEDVIVVTAPLPNATAASPLHVQGRARGTWYFEGSFPVRLLDAHGNELAVSPAAAQGEWMTTEFVPFAVDLSFVQPTTATGELVLEKDNPSGLPENDKSVRIPVRFTTHQ